MRTVIELDDSKFPPKLRMYIHDAPHRRAHRRILEEYREMLWKEWKILGMTIDHPIELSVVFINPTGPDLDNLLTALFQALDGKTGRGPTILADDRLISKVEAQLLRS